MKFQEFLEAVRERLRTQGLSADEQMLQAVALEEWNKKEALRMRETVTPSRGGVEQQLEIARNQNEAEDKRIAAIAVPFLRSILKDVHGKKFEDIKDYSWIIINAGKALREIGTKDALDFLEKIRSEIPDQDMVAEIWGERPSAPRFPTRRFPTKE